LHSSFDKRIFFCNSKLVVDQFCIPDKILSLWKMLSSLLCVLLARLQSVDIEARGEVGNYTDPAGLIPKRIIQTWKEGPLPPDVQARVRGANPDFEYVFFDDDAMFEFVRTRCEPRWVSLFESMPLMIQKVDIFRLLVIRELGGFYFDMDVFCTARSTACLRTPPFFRGR
tara:strand:- start:387 stop:896 length:510 start_codon:yes stop_codon:yes gene_type:complete